MKTRRLISLCLLLLPILPFVISSARAADVAAGSKTDDPVTLANGDRKANFTLRGDATFGWRTQTLSGDIDLGAFTLTMDTGGGNPTRLEGALRGTGNLIWLGGGANEGWQNTPSYLGGPAANTLSGTVFVKQGTLALAKPANVNAIAGDLVLGGGNNQAIVQLEANEQIANGAAVRCVGRHPARLKTKGHSETLGTLGIETDASLHLGGDGTLRFAASAAQPWRADKQLIIYGWKPTAHLFFGRDANALSTAQVRQIGFIDPDGKAPGLYRAQITPTGEILPGGGALRVEKAPFDVSDGARAAREKLYNVPGRASLANLKRAGLRIAFFGDSITWLSNGQASAPAHSATANPNNDFKRNNHFYNLIGRALQEANSDAVLFNHAINGGGAREIWDGTEHNGNDKGKRFQPSFAGLLDADKANVAVIYIGINDVWWRGTTPEEYEKALREMVAQAKARQCAVVLATPALRGEKPDSSNESDDGIDEFCDIMRRVAAETGSELADLRRACMAYLQNNGGELRLDGKLTFPTTTKLTYDGVHPSDLGAALIADQIAQGIVNALTIKRQPVAPAKLNTELPGVAGLNLVPWPMLVHREKGVLPITAQSRIVAFKADLLPLANILSEEIARGFGLKLPVAQGKAGRGDIELLNTGAKQHRFENEEQGLLVGATATVFGVDYFATAQASVTLLQALRRESDALVLPKMTIADSPDVHFRGLQLDVTRLPHSLDSIKQAVQLCRMYKLNHLMLYFIGDEAFMWPSTAFPKLNEYSAKRGRPGYTLAEMQELERYARERGVAILPQLEVPGHASHMVKAMPELFEVKVPTDKTKGYSLPATINIGKREVWAACDTLIKEMSAVFKTTPWFHIGCDEADFTYSWLDPDFQAAFVREDVGEGSDGSKAHVLFEKFIAHLNQTVKAQGKRTIAWESFGPSEIVPRDVTVMMFDNAHPPPGPLAAAGYPLINASWTPLYVVNSTAGGPKPRGEYGHKLSDIYRWNITRFGSINRDFDAATWHNIAAKRIPGALMASWEQAEPMEFATLRLRAAALAERIWNRNAGGDFQNFRARLAATDALLDAQVNAVQFSFAGITDADERIFGDGATLKMTARGPGIIRYTLDGKSVSAQSPRYETPLKLSDTLFVRAALFDDNGVKQGSETQEWLRRSPDARGPRATDYTTFQNAKLQLHAWTGQRVAILTQSADLDAATLAEMTTKLDAVYDFYAKTTSREPQKGKLYDGRLTVAEVNETCGAGCGYLGAGGIELTRETFKTLYDGVKNRHEWDQAICYEFGRNFWFYGDALEYKDLGDVQRSVTTGYAVFMRFAAMEAAQMQGGPFRDKSFANFKTQVEELVDLYEKDPALNWGNTLRLDKAPANPLGLNGTDLFAGFLFRLRHMGDKDFLTRLWQEAAKRPKAQSTQDALDNFVIAACAGATKNLSQIFTQRWRWPLSEAAQDEVKRRFGAPVTLEIAPKVERTP